MGDGSVSGSGNSVQPGGATAGIGPTGPSRPARTPDGAGFDRAVRDAAQNPPAAPAEDLNAAARTPAGEAVSDFMEPQWPDRDRMAAFRRANEATKKLKKEKVSAAWMNQTFEDPPGPNNLWAADSRLNFALRASKETFLFNPKTDMRRVEGLTDYDDGSLPGSEFRAHDTGQVFAQVFEDGVLIADKWIGRSYEILRGLDGTVAIAEFPRGDRKYLAEGEIVEFAFLDGTSVLVANRPWGEVVIAKSDGEQVVGRHIGFKNEGGEPFDGPVDPTLVVSLAQDAMPATEVLNR
jgi:hypothetical protein